MPTKPKKQKSLLDIFLILLILAGIFLFSNSVLAFQSPWPIFGNNPQHTGQSQFLGPQTNEIKWTYQGTEDQENQSIVSRSHIVDSNGNVYLEWYRESPKPRQHKFQAINSNGELKWKIDIPLTLSYPSLLTPAIDSDGIIYLLQTNGILWALDSNDGSLIWENNPDSISGTPTGFVLSNDGIIYIATQFVLDSPKPYWIYGGNLYAIDSNNGEILWTFTQNKGGFRKSPVIGHNGIIYLPSSQTYGNSYLFAIDPNNCSNDNCFEIWQKQISGFCYTTPPVVDKDGTIYIGDKTTLYALNSDGTKEWSKSIGPDGWFAHLYMLSIDNDRETVYLPTNCCGLYAYDFGGSLKWNFQGEEGDYFCSQPIIDANGTIYLVGKHLYVLNPDGFLKWSDQENLYSTAPHYISTPTIGLDGTLYVNPYNKLVKFGGQEQIDNTPPEISNILIEPNKVKVNQSLFIKAKITDESEIISVKANLGGLVHLSLFDDGTHQDENEADGIYANSWTIPEGTEIGEYTVAIIAEDEFGNEGIDNSGRFEVVSVTPEETKKLIKDYFPYWKFSQGEKYYPTSFYFDNDADVENNRENYEARKGDWIKPYVYAHTVEDENYFTIQYWMYMAFNHHRLAPIIPNHDHDWDATIFVIFDKDDFSQPIEVRFARHIYIGVYPWNEIKKNNETHPVAYVAQGSHGAYRSEDMGSLDVFESGGLIYNPNFFNWYKVDNCIEEIKKEINGEQREFCKVENELLKGEEQNEPADGYWPNKFTGDIPFWMSKNAPWYNDEKPTRWFQTRPEGFTRALEFGVDCPVDLHIYDPEGKHIGINYETNKPEIEIPEAIFLQRDDKQYILIPNPIKGDYQVEIIGKDDGEYDFMMLASEDMKLIEKEEKKNVPIAKEETQSFVIPSLWENPREIKQKAIDDLKSIETDNKYHQRNIKQAIKFINKSLNQSFWNDELHLDKKQGMMVFRNELRAMIYLKSFNSFKWRGQKTKSGFDNSQVSSSIKKAIDRLTKADEILDEVVIDEAKNTPVKNNRFKKKVKQLINKAEKELKKAKQNSKDNKPVRAIIHSQNAWHYSQIAIRLAEIEDFDYFKKTKKHKNK